MSESSATSNSQVKQNSATCSSCFGAKRIGLCVSKKTGLESLVAKQLQRLWSHTMQNNGLVSELANKPRQFVCPFVASAFPSSLQIHAEILLCTFINSNLMINSEWYWGRKSFLLSEHNGISFGKPLLRHKFETSCLWLESVKLVCWKSEKKVLFGSQKSHLAAVFSLQIVTVRVCW